MIPILVSRLGNTATMLLNRPKTYNAMNAEFLKLFTKNLKELGSDKSVHGVVITGAGAAFCSGGDLIQVLEQDGSPEDAFYEMAGLFHEGIMEIRTMAKPVIAAINGVAAGGGFSMALACDFRVMAQSASMKQAYTSSGLSLDGGGSFMLPRLVGMARALEIAAFDEVISADQALEWGLVTKVFPDEMVLDKAKDMVKLISKRSLNSLGLSKKLFLQSFSTSFEEQLECERQLLAKASVHSDGLEGLSAFSNKRKPNFNQ